MTGSTVRRSLWRGRFIALLGVVLLSLSMRAAVSAISPITAQISDDIPLSSLGLGVIGMLPPVFFALAGFTAPRLARALGLERALLFATAAMVIGHLARAFAGSYLMLLMGSALALAAMGVGNVLLPPIVKRYFPDRIGLLTALYATLMAVSATLPALTAVPIADATNWHLSLAVWSVVAAMAAVPWIVLLLRSRRSNRAEKSVADIAPVNAAVLGRMRHSPTAWAIALAFSVSTINAYAMFAWLPEILVQTAGASLAAAGAFLALFGVVGLPIAIIAPILVVRMRHPGWIIIAGVLFFLGGFAGILFAPTTLTWLWVVLIGAGPIIFPASLVLINTRTRGHEASVALSGFVQSVGYTIGAAGPLLVGVLHDLTGSWLAPILFLSGFSLLAIISAVVLRSSRFVEDEIALDASARTVAGSKTP